MGVLSVLALVYYSLIAHIHNIFKLSITYMDIQKNCNMKIPQIHFKQQMPHYFNR